MEINCDIKHAARGKEADIFDPIRREISFHLFFWGIFMFCQQLDMIADNQVYVEGIFSNHKISNFRSIHRPEPYLTKQT